MELGVQTIFCDYFLKLNFDFGQRRSGAVYAKYFQELHLNLGSIMLVLLLYRHN